MTHIKRIIFSLFTSAALHASEVIPSKGEVHTVLMETIKDGTIEYADKFIGLTISIKDTVYNVIKVGFLDDRQHTEKPVSFYQIMRAQLCCDLIPGDDKWAYFHENHTSHNGVFTKTEPVESPTSFSAGDRCKFFGEMLPVLFSYNTRIEGGGLFIGFNRVERLTKPHLSADDIHQALLPETVETDSEVEIEGVVYVIKELIVVDEREDKTTSLNEEFTQDKCEYDLQHPESSQCKHFLANSPPMLECEEGIPPLQQLVGLTGKHEYHYHIKSKEQPLELLIGLNQKPEDMTDGEFEI